MNAGGHGPMEEKKMKAFLLAVGLMTIVSIGIGIGMHEFFAVSAEDAFSGSATRL